MRPINGQVWQKKEVYLLEKFPSIRVWLAQAIKDHIGELEVFLPDIRIYKYTKKEAETNNSVREGYSSGI